MTLIFIIFIIIIIIIIIVVIIILLGVTITRRRRRMTTLKFILLLLLLLFKRRIRSTKRTRQITLLIFHFNRIIINTITKMRCCCFRRITLIKEIFGFLLLALFLPLLSFFPFRLLCNEFLSFQRHYEQLFLDVTVRGGHGGDGGVTAGGSVTATAASTRTEDGCSGHIGDSSRLEMGREFVEMKHLARDGDWIVVIIFVIIVILHLFLLHVVLLVFFFLQGRVFFFNVLENRWRWFLRLYLLVTFSAGFGRRRSRRSS
mmetsp:Transcript_13792/g.29344  ORF Transcript_13792/g.29344 Transcript_13792/m.29344 type:complete len:259 (+) Transcript_13792:67-843(+)